MEVNHKNKVFIQIFLSFFLLFFLVLIGFAYNEGNIREKELERENEKFIGLVLSSSKANMEFLENYLNTFKGNTDFLEFISSEKQTPSEIYRMQKLLQRDRELLGRENIDLGIMNLDKASVIFTDKTYDLYNYQRIISLNLFDIKENFLHLEGEYLVKYVPFRLSENSDRIIFVLKLRKDFLQRIFQSDDKIRWYIAEEKGYLDLGDFILREGIHNLKKRESSGLLRDHIYYRIDVDKRHMRFEIFWKLLLGLFLINGISYALARLIFRLTYNPLEESLEELEDSNAKNINEYLKLKELLNNLKRENSLVERKLESSNRFLSSKYLKEFIQGIISYEDLLEKISPKNKIVNMETYQITVIKRQSRDDVYMRESEVLIRDEIERLFRENFQGVEVLDLSHSTTLFITPYDEEKRSFLERMIVHFDKKYSMKLEVISSSKLRDLGEVQREYSDLIKYFDYNLDSNRLITRDNIESVLRRRYYYPLSIEQELIGRIVKGDIDSAKGLVIKIFYENLQERGIAQKEQETLKILMLNTLRRLRNITDTDDERSGRIEQLISRLNLTENMNFEDEYLKSVEVIVRSIGREESREEKSDLREKVEEFIRENYMKEINLQDLADHVGYSQHYMSHVFKGLFKESFRSKINGYRIKRAKEIMAENKNIKIYELAKKTGYNSSSSFIKIFKSIEGCSPGAYKEKIK